MITIATITVLLAASALLMILAITDLKTMLLPNKYVSGLFLCGVLFHILTRFHFEEYISIAMGAICGAGLLFIVRAIANNICKKDTLGMGDIKLMGAAGIWLGAEDILLAITIGASAGLIHGMFYGLYLKKTFGQPLNLGHLKIPAGPGFIFGIVVVAVYKFQSLPQFLSLL